MTTFRVWAPYAEERVELKLTERTLRMERGERGWWSVDAPDANPGDDYSFLIDGGMPLPDPRSPWQPHGVHGPSRLVDHSAFEWTDRHWQARPLSSAVIYELHVGTFTQDGTFEAAIEWLDHLVDLGITHVELMPVAQFPGQRGWGYDGVDLYAPHQDYGGPDGLKRLVDACHARGLAVILDVVYNHLGPEGNYLRQFGPYFTDRHHTAWGDAVNLDGPGSDEVRRFFFDNALTWLRHYHIDGLRIDAVHALVDESAIHFLEELASEVNALSVELGRHLFLIAESDLNDPRIVQHPEVGGYGIDAAWSDDFHHALHALLTGDRDGYYMDFGSIGQLAKALTGAYVYDGVYSPYRQRRHGRPVTAPWGHPPGYHFLGYIQNHDQIGNRAQGDRITHLVNTDLAKIAAVLVFTAPFVPMIFQGEEWGASSPFQFFTSFEDLELGNAVSKGRRREFADFGWDPDEVPDPQERETFLRSKLRWHERELQPHADLLDWHKQLIRLRQQPPHLNNGQMDRVSVRYDEADRWLIVKRGSVAVVCNFAEEAQTVPLSAAGRAKTLLTSTDNVERTEDSIQIPAQSVIVLQKESDKEP